MLFFLSKFSCAGPVFQLPTSFNRFPNMFRALKSIDSPFDRLKVSLVFGFSDLPRGPLS